MVWDARGDDIMNYYFGYIGLVRVMEVICGPKQAKILFYYGLVRLLEWNPASVSWPKSCEFMKYSSSVERKLLRSQVQVPTIVEKKWEEILPNSFKLHWAKIWDTERVRKGGWYDVDGLDTGSSSVVFRPLSMETHH